MGFVGWVICIAVLAAAFLVVAAGVALKDALERWITGWDPRPSEDGLTRNPTFRAGKRP
jgi:hypothetical protein